MGLMPLPYALFGEAGRARSERSRQPRFHEVGGFDDMGIRRYENFCRRKCTLWACLDHNFSPLRRAWSLSTYVIDYWSARGKPHALTIIFIHWPILAKLSHSTTESLFPLSTVSLMEPG